MHGGDVTVQVFRSAAADPSEEHTKIFYLKFTPSTNYTAAKPPLSITVDCLHVV
jgi:hypothetical protein